MTINHGAVADHSLALVGVAALVCLAGAWATSRFFQRLIDGEGDQRGAWLLLTALSSGVTIWCTHFVDILGYRPGVEMDLDWTMTGVSLLIAVAGSAAGFLLAAGAPRLPARPALGGAVVGLAVSAMHYVGMSAMHMPGSMSWDPALIALSVALGIVPAVLALRAACSGARHGANRMCLLFAASVVLMHFTGMASMHHGSGMGAMAGAGTPMDQSSQYVLAVAIAAMSFVTIGAGMVGYLIDDRSRTASLERFRRLAMYDVLTGLPNRASLNDRLEVEIDRAIQQGGRLGLIVIDVDNFKEINDLRGHPAGDEVLRVLGARMAELTQDEEGAFIARMGGDEFVALCRLDGDRELTAFLENLRRVLAPSIQIGKDAIVPRASIGAAVFPDHADDAEALVNNADLAMYRAKSDPLHNVCLYDAAIDGRTRSLRGLSADLREALARDELFLHYQVQTAVETGEARGYEALLRWQHPQQGVISPTDFIPLAEETRLIVPIGAWVLRTACAEAVRWEPPYRLSVNVSAVQLSEPGLAQTVREVLAETGLPADRLELEMTETAVFTDRDNALRTLEEVKALGVGVALDDFGVGYSSLDALRTFPFDRIKIDRSFFSGSGTPQQTVELIQTVLSLGRTFGMAVLAEGIETDDQLALLSQAGCDEAQGFLFGRPTAMADILLSGQLSHAE
ncbi:EAL domain-containing protein [Nocardioides sp. BP30]|uniref:putative bifunctional diguanylate cyclase/phosphodiesterase n=1 Tax=Nocardioides sp. BP30 TaxID=3036374 RepID=UPI0024694EDE|nr:EAL domain-containing protein [Nocardioides sp. BP30]WGL50465.1 EAL domain-containing protein [Nocardioides sp. BP30]